ncbi:MAG: hypothetical protein ACYS8K_03795, partial [Planctomycetota bacterium]
MGVERTSEGGKSYRTFGWQGINLTVLSSWDLTIERGNRAAGQVRLADDDALRLEVRWQKAQPGTTARLAVEGYLRKLSKRAEKDGVELRVRRDLNLASPEDKEVECYQWMADRQAVAMVSLCRACGRLVHIHVLGALEEPLRNTARTVFASLRDHAEGDWELWRFLDVEFRVPAALPLASKSLRSGCIRMAFGGRRRRLEFVRVSLAELLVGEGGLEQWFREFYGASLKRRSVQIQQGELKGH